MAEAIKQENYYHSAFRELQAEDSGDPSWLQQLRENAFDHFAAVGFPSVAEEEWKYTNVAPIARADFSPIAGTNTWAPRAIELERHVYPETEQSRLVFVNGMLRPDLSSLAAVSSGVKTLSFDEALRDEEFRDVIREHLGRVVGYQENGFTALNTAFIGNGVLVLLKRNQLVQAPLQLLFLTEAEHARPAVFPRVLLIAEENSQATIIESHSGTNHGPYFTNAVVEVVLKDQALLEHYRVQNESAEAFHVTTTRAGIGRSASFVTTNITLGAQLSRHNLSAIMDEEGGECRLDGLYIVGDGQHADTHSVIDHRKPRCTSQQLYKGILDGKSRAVFNGKVFVRHGAAGTDANQTNKNLLLSNEAHVDTKPQLEIYADDVKCAHGAAIGQIDEDELFYLESRGIHVNLARNLLTYGFAEEVIARIKIVSIKKQLDEAVLNRLHTRLEA